MGSRTQVDPSDLLILQQLRGQPDAFVSGSRLAELLGMSRAAVGKRVNLLRDAGWEIDATPRLGYRLREEPDVLHPLVIEARRTTRWLGQDYRYLEVVGSTNEELGRWALDGAAAGTVLVADRQEAGRGRLGRAWESPPGQNLYLSVLLRPSWAPSELPPITLAVAVAVARALEPFLGAAPLVKWPNDLLTSERRKLCGILAEMSAELDSVRHIVLGVGINVNQTRFGRALGNTASSLRRETGRAVSRAEVLLAVLAELEEWLDVLLGGGEDGRDRILQEWLTLAEPWLGGQVTVHDMQGVLEGRAVGIDTSGALLVEADGVQHRILAGDLRLSI